MKINKAVITAASRDQRMLPLQRLVDVDGVEKTALHIIVDEAVAAGVEEVAVIVCPGDEATYAAATEEHAGRLHVIPQPAPRGYGDAILRAREFTAGQPFLHLVSDHLYVSHARARCARQVVEIAEREDTAVLAVQPTREKMLPYFGTVSGRRVAGQHGLYDLDRVLEKPTPTEAEQSLMVPGLRAGFYLCLFGVHVLTPAIMDLLEEDLAATNGNIALSGALARLASHERVLGLEVDGDRYNIGIKYGLLISQLALSMAGSDRDLILTELVDLLAADRRREPRA